MNTPIGSISSDALTEAIRAHYAAEASKHRGENEFTTNRYMTDNKIEPSARLRIKKYLDAEVKAGRLHSRIGIDDGKSSTLYSFVIQ